MSDKFKIGVVAVVIFVLLFGSVTAVKMYQHYTVQKNLDEHFKNADFTEMQQSFDEFQKTLQETMPPVEYYLK